MRFERTTTETNMGGSAGPFCYTLVACTEILYLLDGSAIGKTVRFSIIEYSRAVEILIAKKELDEVMSFAHERRCHMWRQTICVSNSVL
jgi:hypothetical protein